jgi:hypothetical protein
MKAKTLLVTRTIASQLNFAITVIPYFCTPEANPQQFKGHSLSYTDGSQ